MGLWYQELNEIMGEKFEGTYNYNLYVSSLSFSFKRSLCLQKLFYLQDKIQEKTDSPSACILNKL